MSKFFKDKNIVSLEEQLKWIEKQTDKVIKRLPTLKKALKVYDDRSDELYNLDAEEIKLMSKVYKSSISKGEVSGTTEVALDEFATNLSYYGDTNIEKLVEVATNTRINSFLENIKAVASEEEYAYVVGIINELTDSQKAKFTKSKYFFDNGNLSSDNFVKFLNEYGVSVGTAKLEGFLASIGLEVQGRYYVKGETRIKLGRPKRKGRKSK